MSPSDVLVSAGHMFLHFQNLVIIVDENPPSIVDIVPGIPEERELGGPHLLHPGIIDRLVGGEVVHTHIVQPGFCHLVLIGEVGKKMDNFHITVSDQIYIQYSGRECQYTSPWRYLPGGIHEQCQSY